METIRQHFSLESKDQHASASFESAQIVMGLGFLQAKQIYRRHSVMQQDDMTSRQVAWILSDYFESLLLPQ